MTFVGNYPLRIICDFGAVVCDSKKIGGGQRKPRGREGKKNRAVVWQWVPTFKEAVPPPPWHQPFQQRAYKYHITKLRGDPHRHKRASHHQYIISLFITIKKNSPIHKLSPGLIDCTPPSRLFTWRIADSTCMDSAPHHSSPVHWGFHRQLEVQSKQKSRDVWE